MERELLKLNSLGAAAAETLVLRGVPELQARLAGNAAVTVFSIGFDTWVGDEPPGDFAECIRVAAAELRVLASTA